MLAGKIQKATQVWVVSRVTPANQLQSGMGGDSRRCKLIIREASEGKRKGRKTYTVFTGVLYATLQLDTKVQEISMSYRV